MLNAAPGLVPVFTTEAGSCLTSANWQAVNITAAAFYLDPLLVKPGMHFLQQTDNLKQYLGWTGDLVINAINLSVNKAGVCAITSAFDGSKLTFTMTEIVELIQQLKPDAVVLPAKVSKTCPTIWDNWPADTLPFLAVEDLETLPPVNYGVYFSCDSADTMDTILSQLTEWSHVPRYISGDFDAGCIQQLAQAGVAFIETDRPARDGMHGLMYDQNNSIDLSDSATALCFAPLADGCTCPTCTQCFTQAYLHHLLLHTPLLCHRLLIQHNVYCAQSQQPIGAK